jgi:N-acetylmuramoyl-L-alanine amidase
VVRPPWHAIAVTLVLTFAGCATPPATPPSPAPPPPPPQGFIPRQGDEIIVAGQLFHTGTRVITWMDPGGYDAYRVERRFVPFADSDWAKTQAAPKETAVPLSPSRYGLRGATTLDPATIERVRGGGWELAALQQMVDQFVLHYDAVGLSKLCFQTLHDKLGLSVHFLLDIDGTIYQTLDLKERAYHATIANSRSIGIEIAHIGAYPPNEAKAMDEWYRRDATGNVAITIPPRAGDPLFPTQGFVGRPDRPALVRGTIQNLDLVQYDFTPQQYAALIKLTAALCTVFPKIRADYPRDAGGRLITEKLSDDQFAKYQGILGHYHIQANKTDPGPALQWDRVIDGAKALMPPSAR